MTISNQDVLDKPEGVITSLPVTCYAAVRHAYGMYSSRAGLHEITNIYLNRKMAELLEACPRLTPALKAMNKHVRTKYRTMEERSKGYDAVREQLRAEVRRHNDRR